MRSLDKPRQPVSAWQPTGEGPGPGGNDHWSPGSGRGSDWALPVDTWRTAGTGPNPEARDEGFSGQLVPAGRYRGDGLAPGAAALACAMTLQGWVPSECAPWPLDRHWAEADGAVAGTWCYSDEPLGGVCGEAGHPGSRTHILDDAGSLHRLPGSEVPSVVVAGACSCPASGRLAWARWRCQSVQRGLLGKLGLPGPGADRDLLTGSLGGWPGRGSAGSETMALWGSHGG